MSIVNADAYMYSRMLMNGDDITHGQEWKKHKYIRKEQTKAGKTRYIYPSKNNKDRGPSIKDPNAGPTLGERYNNPPARDRNEGPNAVSKKKIQSLINNAINASTGKKLKDQANLAKVGNSFIDALKDTRKKRNLGPSLSHSAKGSTWKEHKYIKRVNGTYYYPASYKGGRHLEEGGGTDEENAEYDQAAGALSAEDIEALAKEVIRGNFGNGQERKDLLGDNYRAIQDRVNEILLGGSSSAGSKELYTVPNKTVDAGKKAVDGAIRSNKSLAESLISFGTKMGVLAPNERGKRQSEKRK